MALKWGIVSAGKVAHDFINALGTLQEGTHEVVAVAARDLIRAKDVAKRFNVQKAYGTYLELAQDPNIEVVHIGVLNRQHYEVTHMMLSHGKHVLVEKPMCINEKQVKKLIELSTKMNLFMMEGIWSRFFPSYQYIRQQIKNGALGDVLCVEADFGNGAVSVDRLSYVSHFI